MNIIENLSENMVIFFLIIVAIIFLSVLEIAFRDITSIISEPYREIVDRVLQALSMLLIAIIVAIGFRKKRLIF